MTRAETGRPRSPRARPLTEWAGDSGWRRLVAWLVRTAVLAAAIAAAVAVVWLVALPWVVNGYREFFLGR